MITERERKLAHNLEDPMTKDLIEECAKAISKVQHPGVDWDDWGDPETFIACAKSCLRIVERRGGKGRDTERLEWLEQHRGVFHNDRYNGWRISEDGGPNDKPWHPSARSAIDVAMTAEKKSKRKGGRP